MLIASPNVTAAVAEAEAAATAAAASATAAAASATLAATYASDSDPTETYATKASVEVATIAAATLFVRTAGYTTPGDHGGALYVRVTSEPSLPGKIRSTDRYLPDGTTSAANGGWWKIRMPRVTPQMFGAKADNSTNDYQAIMDAINHELIGISGARPVDFPAGKYKVGSTINLKKVVHLNGLGGVGADGYGYYENGPELIFPADTLGICVNRADTLSTGLDSPSTTGADGSIIEGLTLTGSGTDHAKHGIWLRARAILRNLVVQNFPGNGVNIVASSGGSALTQGNANSWQIDTLSVGGVGENGVYVSGADVNAGEGRNISASYCGHYGIYDFSFLGNTYYACHTVGNAVGVATSESGIVFANYSNVRYHTMPDATEAQYVATTPGTDETVWLTIGANVAADTWSPGLPSGTFVAGGGYRVNGAVNCTRIISCYAESGQGRSDFAASALVLGGAMADAGFTQGGNIAGRYGNQIEAKSLKVSDGSIDGAISNPGLAVSLAPSWSSKLIARWYQGTTDDAMSISRTGTDWLVGPYRATGATTTEKFRTAANKTNYAWIEGGFAMGASTQTHRQYVKAVNSPVSDEGAQGDVAWYTRFDGTGNSTGRAAYVCIGSGNPGTWRVLALDDYQTIATDADFTLTSEIGETRHTGTLTADRAVTLTAPDATWTGHSIRITRSGGGAFNLNVGTGPLKAMPASSWAEFAFDGTAWYLAAYGTL